MSKPCEDCEAVRNFSFEPRCQGALCAGCAEKLAALVTEYQEQECGLVAEMFACMERRDFAEARVRKLEDALKPFADVRIGRGWVFVGDEDGGKVRGSDVRSARRLLGLEVDNG